VAKKYNNFKKFRKLVSIVKKISDENPDLRSTILNESTSTSNNSWNKIQNWTSQFLFAELKTKPLKFFNEDNIQKHIEDKILPKKKSSCFSVFKVPTADLGRVDPFELEETLRRLPQNLQVQIDFSSGNSNTNTGIQKIEEIPTVGNGQLTSGIRELYPDIENVKFIRMRKKDAKQGDKSNCSYFVKIIFEDDILSPDEELRRVDIGVSVDDLTAKQRKDRLKLKKQIDDAEKDRKFKLKSIPKPTKVDGLTTDDEFAQTQAKLPKTPDEAKAEKFREFNTAIANLRELLDSGAITKKQFRQAFDKLNDNLRRGGVI